MRRFHTLALAGFSIVAAVAASSRVDALTVQKAYKEVVLSVVVTPSPAPIVYRSAQPRRDMRAFVTRFADLMADAFAGPRQVASSDAFWDVAPGVMIAQVSAQPSPVPVQFVAKPDPNGMYLQVYPHTPTLNAPYGTTVYPCAFEIYTYYTTAYTLSDWGYGSGTSGTGTYPIENYPTTSYLSWATPDFGPTVKPYANQGGPGQTSWGGTAGQAQRHCFDLTLNVPASQAPGTYNAVVQYNLYVTY